MESWEERAEEEQQQGNTLPPKMNGGGDKAAANTSQGNKNQASFAFNANAKPFTFNPGASAFTPSWTKKQVVQEVKEEQKQETAAPAPAAAAAATTTNAPVGAGGAVTQEKETGSEKDQVKENMAKLEEEVTKKVDIGGEAVKPAPAAAAAAAVAATTTAPAVDEAAAVATPTTETHTSSSPAPSTPTTPSAARLAEEEALALEEEAAVDDREHLNVVFIGHVDAGKSTIGGQILFLTGCVDERTIQKYEREAKEKNRESWYMAYIMDTNDEERAKGKTVEVGRAHFETEMKRYTVLDAPGHKNYVPNMIGGAAQADIGVLVIAARRGEFETGFERGGQTREHAQLAKTLGIAKLIVVVNKMDDQSVQWNKERYDEVVTKMSPFLKSCGYNLKRDVIWCPISGLKGTNIKDPVSKDVCDWYDGGSLFNILDNLEPLDRDAKGPFRMPILDKYRDLGTNVMGKSESGSVRKGDTLMVMPNKVEVKVAGVYREADEIKSAGPGENLRLRLTGIEEEDVQQGYVVCSISEPIASVTEIDAQVAVLELLEHKAIFTAGYKAVFHIHTSTEECEVIALLGQIDPKTKKRMKKKTLFVKSGSIVDCRIQVAQPVCVEIFKEFPQLGRFTLRDEGKTIAIGKVTGKPTKKGK